MQPYAVGVPDQPVLSDEAKSECRLTVLGLFSDIDRDYLVALCEQKLYTQDVIIEHILNEQENGRSYPRASRSNRKRKRGDDYEDDDNDPAMLHDMANKFDNPGRRTNPKSLGYVRHSHELLRKAFPWIRMEDLIKIGRQHGHCFYPTYLALDKMVLQWQLKKPDFKFRDGQPPIAPLSLEDLDRLVKTTAPPRRELFEEYRAARVYQLKSRSDAEEKQRKKKREDENLAQAVAEGSTRDCGCCFVECAINRMVHCDSEVLHWFCQDCARQMAETQVGLAKYHLNCMSIDGCHGGFDRTQRDIFLDAKLKTALDRNEQKAVLQTVGIENLVHCPFCPFAMEYPSIEEDKEFRCLRPDCGIVSCRACRRETHLPRSCEEVAQEEKSQAPEHAIEEAMSQALIRNCNKCSTPFVKTNGCNKMTCPQCKNIQCYICSKSCDYTHFYKAGGCQLHDGEGGIDARHEEEVRTAEVAARNKALQGNGGFNVALEKTVARDNKLQDATRARLAVQKGREQKVAVDQRMAPNDEAQRRAFRDAYQRQDAIRRAQAQRLNQLAPPTMRAPLTVVRPLPPPQQSALDEAQTRAFRDAYQRQYAIRRIQAQRLNQLAPPTMRAPLTVIRPSGPQQSAQPLRPPQPLQGLQPPLQGNVAAALPQQPLGTARLRTNAPAEQAQHRVANEGSNRTAWLPPDPINQGGLPPSLVNPQSLLMPPLQPANAAIPMIAQPPETQWQNWDQLWNPNSLTPAVPAGAGNAGIAAGLPKTPNLLPSRP